MSYRAAHAVQVGREDIVWMRTWLREFRPREPRRAWIDVEHSVAAHYPGGLSAFLTWRRSTMSAIPYAPPLLPPTSTTALRAVSSPPPSAPEPPAPPRARRLRTRGISPKLIGAITTPLGAAAYDLIVTGTLNRPALGALALGVIAALSVYAAPPGEVVAE